jgi:hypothetical protein
MGKSCILYTDGVGPASCDAVYLLIQLVHALYSLLECIEHSGAANVCAPLKSFMFVPVYLDSHQMWASFFAATALPMNVRGLSVDTIAIYFSEAVFGFLQSYVKV